MPSVAAGHFAVRVVRMESALVSALEWRAGSVAVMLVAEERLPVWLDVDRQQVLKIPELACLVQPG